MTPDPDMISRAEADRQTQEAVAAVLMEAMNKVNEACDGSLSLESGSDEDCAYDDGVREGCAAAIHAIRALITENAQSALTKMLAEAKAEGMREAADKAFSMIDSPWDDYVRATIRAAADAIQKEEGQ